MCKICKTVVEYLLCGIIMCCPLSDKDYFTVLLSFQGVEQQYFGHVQQLESLSSLQLQMLFAPHCASAFSFSCGRYLCWCGLSMQAHNHTIAQRDTDRHSHTQTR